MHGVQSERLNEHSKWLSFWSSWLLGYKSWPKFSGNQRKRGVPSRGCQFRAMDQFEDWHGILFWVIWWANHLVRINFACFNINSYWKLESKLTLFRWDTRKLNEPLERLLIDPIKTDEQSISRSFGVTVLEYETTMPTKFMCGTDVGMVFVCNRKGKSPMEKINFRVNINK